MHLAALLLAPALAFSVYGFCGAARPLLSARECLIVPAGSQGLPQELSHLGPSSSHVQLSESLGKLGDLSLAASSTLSCPGCRKW